MARTEDLLHRWRTAGLITAETVEAIERFEHGREKPDESARPGVLEALLYLGVAVLSVGFFTLFAQNWDDLQSWARVTAIACPTVLIFLVGAVLHSNGELQLQRGSQAAWLVTVGMFAGSAAVVINEYSLGLGKPGDPGALLTIAAVTFGLAVALWVVSPSYPQVLAIAGATVFLGEAAGNWPDNFSAELAGMTIFVIAAAGIALAETGWFKPLLATRFLFSSLLIMGPFQAGVDNGPFGFEVLAAVAAAGVIAYGVVRASFPVVLVGVVGSFFVLFNFVVTHFSERLGAPMAFMICGGFLVAGVLLLAWYRRGSTARFAP